MKNMNLVTLPEEGNDGKDRNWKNVMDRVKRCDAGWSAPKSLKVMRKTTMEKIESRRRSFVCFLLFILLLPSVSPLSMSQSGLPLAVIRVPVGKSVLARTLLQVGRILSLVFAPCDPPSLFKSGAFSPVALLKYLPLPSRNPATQSPSYLVIM